MSDIETADEWLDKMAWAWEEGNEELIQEFADGWVEEGDLASHIICTAKEYYERKILELHDSQGQRENGDE